MANEVTVFYQRQSELISHLLSVKELTLAQDAEQMLQKNLPLAAASYFEHHVTEALQSFVNAKSNNCVELACLFDQKVIKRQYHTLFDWEKSNVNKFLGLFGEEFKTAATAEIAADGQLTQAAKDFLAIGEMRNRIVHQNYATYVAEKSAAEIFELFLSAERFVAYAKQRLA